MFKPNIGECIACKKQSQLIVVKAGYCNRCNHKIKQDKKAGKIVKMIKADNKLTYPELKKQLWEIFSEYIRRRDSENETFVCISCQTFKSSREGNLQAGHYYKSETCPALRYDEVNVNGQCKSCNIFKEGNRQGYEIGLLKKYGQKAVDILKIKSHNKVDLGRFELELLIKHFKTKIK